MPSNKGFRYTVMRHGRAVLSMACAVVLAATVSVLVTNHPGRAASADASAVPCASGTTVQTADGPVCGISSGGVNEWLGIPYAAPPVGALRWQPPQAPAQWTTTLNATAFGPECVQTSPDRGGVSVAGSSENCLFVNVWAPQSATSGENLPVMVHIHGGGFYAGNGNADNSLLAGKNEVIVSMNYRLGIFGFLANPALGAHSGDYGLQDQQAALRWVQTNIAQFGGNPNKVTIFGESAGGSSVCDQIASPTAKGLFTGAISTSGEYNTLLGTLEPTRPNGSEDLESQDCKSVLPTAAQADSAGRSFAAAVGCGSGTGSAVATCLQQVPTDKVAQTADTPGDGFQFGGQGTIAPTINGSTLTETLRQALRTGDVNRVPVIAGTDRDEDLIGDPTTRAAYRKLVKQEYPGVADEVLSRYPVTSFDSPFIAWRTVAADSSTVCPSITTDKDLAKWMPTYAYLITDEDIPPYAPQGTVATPAGASHVGAWFLNPVTPALDANQQALQDQEIAEVTTFARKGNPSAKGSLAWPEFGASKSEMELAPAGDSQTMPIAQISATHNCDFWDSIAPTS